jgi:hypothetical protein
LEWLSQVCSGDQSADDMAATVEDSRSKERLDAMSDREVRLNTILTEPVGRDRGADDMPGDVVAPGGPQAGRLPNLVIVGVSRAGTTSLFNYLGQHPDVGSSEVKELRYFTAVRHGQALEPLASYAAHFRWCTQTYAMEATPGYFCGGHAVASALDETCPSARALVCLRNPVDRCWSWFRFVKSRDRIPKDMSFGEYLDSCETFHEQGVDSDREHQAFWGLGGGCYAEWLDAWVDTFGDRFRVSFFDDLQRDPRGAVKSHCRWLGIDDGVVDDFDFALTNRSVLYRNRVLQKGAVVLNRRAESFFRRYPSLKRTLRDTYYAFNKAPAQPGMSADERERLNHFYRPYNSRLGEQLTRIGLTVPSSWSPAS